MSLHGKFNVGFREIGDFEIIRRSNVEDAVLDENLVSEYSYSIGYTNIDGSFERKTGTVSHRFGDGALELLAKVFIMSSPVY